MPGIGFFYRDLFSSGGMPREIRTFIRTLDSQGHDVWGFGYGAAERDSSEGPRSRLVQLLRPGFFFAMPRKLTRLLEQLRKDGLLDLMVVVGGHVPSNYAVCRFCHRKGIPYLFSPGAAYTPLLLTRRRRLRKRAWRFFETRILRWATAIRTYSPTNSGQIRSYLPTDRFLCLKEGVDREEIPEAVEPAVFPQGWMHLLYLGRVDIWGKGIDELIAAVELLIEGKHRVLLHIVGPVAAREQPRFRRLLDRLPEDAYRYHGPIFGPQRFGYYKAADIFLYPSRHEGIPRATREAIAMGLPLIVTPETNMAEDVAESGAGYACGCSGPEIAGCIERFIALSPEERRDMGRQAARLAATVYDWPAICAGFTAEWEKKWRNPE